MRRAALALLVLVALAGCGQIVPDDAQPPRPTATIAPFFSGAEPLVPTFDIPTPAPRPTPASQSVANEPSSAQGAAQRDPLDRIIEEVTIYDERLDPNWSTSYSFWHLVNLESSDTSFSGFVSLKAVPERVLGGTALTINKDSRKIYPRADILGLRFNVSGGRQPLTPYNLILRVLGSNRYPYFEEDDTSLGVAPSEDTGGPAIDLPLEKLGLRRDLKPGEWAEMEMWFDTYDRVDYRYLTGFVVMNDQSYMKPFYIDNVRLLVRQP